MLRSPLQYISEEEEAVRRAREDLGDHRMEALPLAGKALSGRQLATLRQNLRGVNEDVLAWHQAFTDEEQPTVRADGIGLGGSYRLGPNYRPGAGRYEEHGRNTTFEKWTAQPFKNMGIRQEKFEFTIPPDSGRKKRSTNDTSHHFPDQSTDTKNQISYSDARMSDRNFIAAYPNPEDRLRAIEATDRVQLAARSKAKPTFAEQIAQGHSKPASEHSASKKVVSSAGSSKTEVSEHKGTRAIERSTSKNVVIPTGPSKTQAVAHKGNSVQHKQSLVWAKNKLKKIEQATKAPASTGKATPTRPRQEQRSRIVNECVLSDEPFWLSSKATSHGQKESSQSGPKIDRQHSDDHQDAKLTTPAMGFNKLIEPASNATAAVKCEGHVRSTELGPSTSNDVKQSSKNDLHQLPETVASYWQNVVISPVASYWQNVVIRPELRTKIRICDTDTPSSSGSESYMSSIYSDPGLKPVQNIDEDSSLGDMDEGKFLSRGPAPGTFQSMSSTTLAINRSLKLTQGIFTRDDQKKIEALADPNASVSFLQPGPTPVCDGEETRLIQALQIPHVTIVLVDMTSDFSLLARRGL